MKTKIFLFSLLLSALYWACDDSIDSVGIGIQPPGDRISVYDTIINIDSAYTVKFDSIYAKTIYGLLGNFYDPEYGDIKAGYICQYYPSLRFADSVVNHKIDSVYLTLLYSSYFGDSLAPMEVSVYPVTKNPLLENYYTNVSPSDYCDLNQVWAKKAYTAYDLSVSDSIHNLSYYKAVAVPLPTEWGQELYEEYVRNGKTEESWKSVVEKFKGTYLESSFGTGNLLKVDITEIYVYYQGGFTTTKQDSDEDSSYVATSSAVLTVTNEMMQLNRFEDRYAANLLEPNSEKMYLKTPVGLFSKIVVPIPEIVNTIGKKKFSGVMLNIGAYPPSEREYPYPIAGSGASESVGYNTSSPKTFQSKLLLIESDSVKSFFENQKLADSGTTYTTTYTTSTQSYSFDNIANLIQNAIAKDPTKNLELLLIPVQVEYSTDGYSIQNISTGHYLLPSAATLKKGGNNLQLKIIASDLEINSR